MPDGELARQRQCVEQLRDRWPAFRAAREQHLSACSVGQTPAEKIAENILCDLFTRILDWTTSQVRLQENRIDLSLVRNGVMFLVVEAKRPGSFDGPGSIAAALRQARGYAEERRVDKIAVSDGCVFQAYDLTPAGLRLRVRTHLAQAEVPEELWWLSTRGIYRTPPSAVDNPAPRLDDEQVLHPKYRLPARCFAYVGQVDKPATWKLPYLRMDGSADERRLPKAIQAVLRDYRGEQVRLPEERVPDVLVCLAREAVRQHRMPHQDPTPATIYQALLSALTQLGRQDEILGPALS